MQTAQFAHEITEAMAIPVCEGQDLPLSLSL